MGDESRSGCRTVLILAGFPFLFGWSVGVAILAASGGIGGSDLRCLFFSGALVWVFVGIPVNGLLLSIASQRSAASHRPGIWTALLLLACAGAGIVPAMAFAMAWDATRLSQLLEYGGLAILGMYVSAGLLFGCLCRPFLANE